MLPSNELSRLRTDILYTLSETCAILTGTATADGFGGQSITWGTTYASVACRMDHRVTREGASAGGVQTFTTNILSMPGTTAITTANRVEYGSSTYNVVAVNQGFGLAVKRVIVEEV